jgi:hypothetical protein
MSPIRCALAMLLGAALAQAPSGATAIRADYIRALGGAEALKMVTSRITEGRFDNGRGLTAAFRLYEKAPDKRLTTIGDEPLTSPEGSGRGYDGRTGWDKNFIGTGLRTLQGLELADCGRDADFFGPLHIFDVCSTVSVDSSTETRALCRLPDGRTDRYVFAGNGLLSRKDIELHDGLGIVSQRFNDYRQVDATLVPFRTTVVLPDGIAVTFITERVRHNAPIDDAAFVRPAR